MHIDMDIVENDIFVSHRLAKHIPRLSLRNSITTLKFLLCDLGAKKPDVTING